MPYPRALLLPVLLLACASGGRDDGGATDPSTTATATAASTTAPTGDPGTGLDTSTGQTPTTGDAKKGPANDDPLEKLKKEWKGIEGLEVVNHGALTLDQRTVGTTRHRHLGNAGDRKRVHDAEPDREERNHQDRREQLLDEWAAGRADHLGLLRCVHHFTPIAVRPMSINLMPMNGDTRPPSP